MAAPLIVTIGDLVEDIVVTPTGRTRRGTDQEVEIQRRRGGSAANFAAAVVRTGGRCRFVGAVGSDALGDRLIDVFVNEGMDVVVERGAKTGVVIVRVDRGERMFFTDRGCVTELREVDPAVLDGASWLHVPAYSLQTDPLRQRRCVCFTRRSIGHTREHWRLECLGTRGHWSRGIPPRLREHRACRTFCERD